MNKFCLLLGLTMMSLLAIISCKEKSLTLDKNDTNTESLEIFTAKSDGKGYIKDSLIYKEVTSYQKGNKISTTYFEANGNKYGIESFKYDDNGGLLHADYKDAKDSLLSYYKYICDNKGTQVSSTAFDASNDQALRIEKYGHDSNNKLMLKEIYSTNNVLQRRYTFENDTEGLAQVMYVVGAVGDTIAIETYKYTKYDNKKRWTEKWGFVNDQPKTCYLRTFDDK